MSGPVEVVGPGPGERRLSPMEQEFLDAALRAHAAAEIARRVPPAPAPPVVSVVPFPAPAVSVRPVVERRFEVIEVDRRDQTSAAAPLVIAALMVAVVLVATVGALAVGVAS